MFRWWKVGFVAVGLGVVLGGGSVAWLYTHRDDGSEAAAQSPASSSGPVLGDSAGSGDSLSVTTNGTQGLSGGQSLSGGDTGSSGSVTAGDGSGNGSDQLPSPSQFKVYDQYKNNPTALYIDVKPGTGKAVAEGSVVTINYRGWLTNGKEFDESYSGGKPFTFTEGAGTVIEGMAQAIFGMKAGGTRRLIIPPTVGYGAAGHDPIPPDAVMVFDVELVSVQ